VSRVIPWHSYVKKWQSTLLISILMKKCSPSMFRWLLRRKEKICLVPVTRPYLFFSPGPKLFFSFEYENFGPIFYSIFKRIVKNVLKRSCKHSKNKTKLDNFSLSFESMICCLDLGKVNFKNRNRKSLKVLKGEVKVLF